MAKRKSAKKRSAKKSDRLSPAKTIAAVMDNSLNDRERILASQGLSAAIFRKEGYFQKALDLVLDKDQSHELRMECLQELQAASFQTIDFEKYRKGYVAAMRKLARDADPKLRLVALNILSCQQDGYAQKKLLEGLKKPEKALVEPEQALQLLGNDVHADAYAVARDIVKKSPSTTIKREALKLLAADSSAAKIFEKVLLDKNEDTETRQICAAALQSIKPKSLFKHARNIVRDLKESDDLHATCLTALTNFSDGDDVRKDESLMKRVKDLRSKGKAMVKRQARQFLKKFDD